MSFNVLLENIFLFEKKKKNELGIHLTLGSDDAMTSPYITALGVGL